jgi:hypothetical protein
MPDPNSLYVTNLLEALKLLNQWLALGIVSAISAAALDRKSRADPADLVTVLGFVPMGRGAAQLLLIGVAFVAGLMASFTAASAAAAVTALQGYQFVLKAACTFPSVATAPVGLPVLAALLPVAFGGWVIGRKLLAIREVGILLMLLVYAVPYGATAIALARLPCRVT